ncbi:coagulation factor VIII-like isoform X1 [Bufo gargarizans]|uniref:coagulation factor VIII-like isoform X1 n=1 Tax=Bufo gargarizans TaxID=30331 RepID=UPI001CF15B7A|nr:coagulation factor VIII-like isoform X1 [Bufo gargarizans]
MRPVIFLHLSVFCYTCEAITRIFYIAAVEQLWNYREGTVFSEEQRTILRSPDSQIYKKALYVEYTDEHFTDIKPQEHFTGLLGPTVRVETFDTVIIHFKNLANIPFSLHGVGVSYGKSSEGAGYSDGTGKLEKADDAVPPGHTYTYIWKIPENYGPAESDPICLTSAYYSHCNSSYDINSGLVGAILICKPGSLTEDGHQYGVQEKIIALAVFDEGHSHYSHDAKVEPIHTINGHINGSIPEQNVCLKKPIHFHVIGFGTHFEVHSISLERHSFVIRDHRVPVLSVTAFTFLTAIVHPGETGVYTLSCQTWTHPEGNMTSLIKVENCASESEKRMRVLANDDDDDYEDYYESTVLNLDEDNDTPHVDIRSHGKRKPVTWTHYIAAIELEWDYQLEKGNKRTRFTKAVYKEFTDSRFTHPRISEIPGTGILGPVLRGEVGDQIRIVFKNMAHHPFNIYPQGLSNVSSTHRFLTGEQLKDYPVQPNESITYIWPVTKFDSPASSDPKCLTRYYASFHNPRRDLASGLIGPLLICSKQTLDQGGNQIVTDKEHILFFSVFDETLSWYHTKNFQSSENITSDISPRENLLYTINGLVSSLHLTICQNEVSVWHVLNLVQETELLSIYFGGSTFFVDSSYEETLTLFPMNGKTVIMVMEKKGQWSVTTKSSLAELGMRATLSVSHCEDPQDEYYDYDHDNLKELQQDSQSYHLDTSHKMLPFGPRSMFGEKKSAGHLKNTISDDDDAFSFFVNSSNPIIAMRSATDKKEMTEMKKEEKYHSINEMPKDKKEESKQFQNKSELTKKMGAHVDFYDYDYGNSNLEYIDMYSDLPEKDPRSSEGQLRTYFIAAVEVMWDYRAGTSPYFIKQNHHYSHGFQRYKKVVFREYLDSSFKEPALRGERDAHLGLLGPCIRAEVNDEIIVQFKNMASRPYSFFSNVLAVPWREENVPPQQTRTYTGKVSSQFAPTDSEEECRTWFYTSNTHPYKDFHSGLFGPLLICRPKVLKRSNVLQLSMQDFSLIFMDINETESWYFKENWRQHCPLTCTAKMGSIASCPAACNMEKASAELQHEHIFHAINGYVDDTTPGLVLSLKRKVRWHLMSLGRTEIISIQFHGNILTQRSHKDHPINIVNLYPGVGVTLEMEAHTTGLWHIESEAVYESYKMKAIYLVYDARCHQPLGLSTGKIRDSEISASGHYGSWIPSLARLRNTGSINAWSVDSVDSWIQVDLRTPMLVHSIQTQGARQRLLSIYISQFLVFYSLNGEKWSPYQGNTSSNQMVFFGNVDASTIRENSFDPPIIARFLRLHPTHTGARAGLRMELFGCDLTSCSLPLGMESGEISSYHISASSYSYSVFSSWAPNLARLNQRGRINAWRPQADTQGEWLQVDLAQEMKVTGLKIQGARSSFTSMYITHFFVSFSNDGKNWTFIREENGQRKIFQASMNSDTPVWVTFDMPIITRFMKLYPEKWMGGIALRMEVMGCNI